MEVPARVEVEAGERVVLTWDDGSETMLTARRLRGACSCAGCREPAGIRATQQLLAGEAAISISETSLVGSYAINFIFAPDGHHTGIFPFDTLRSLGEED